MISTGDTWTLHLGDCIEGMRGLADQSVDVTITDPPYSRDLYSRTRTNKGTGLRPNGRPTSSGEGKQHTSAFQLASKRIGAIDDILDEVATEILRVTKRWIIVFSDIEIAPRWRDQFGAAYIRTGVWVKPDPMPQVTGDRPAQGFEPATIAHRPGRKRWNGGGRPATWIVGTCKGHERPDHPSPKPIDLMLRLVEDFSERGETVLDPFSGSGTTGVACRMLGRGFLGWELDKEFHALASRRIGGDEAKPNWAQPSLFGGAL